jgi:hypothetical protein
MVILMVILLVTLMAVVWQCSAQPGLSRGCRV